MAASTLSIKLRCASWQQLATIYRRDLSRGSMFLKASTQPPLGTQVKIDLELPSATVLELVGSISEHVTDPQRGTGVQLALEPLPTKTVWLIESALAAENKVRAATQGGAGQTGVNRTVADPDASGTPGESQAQMTEGENIAEAEAELIRALEAEAESLRKLNPFLVLGVGYETTDADVRSAFGELTKRYHPDRFARYQSTKLRQIAAEIFILIRDAYRRLADQQSRQQVRATIGGRTPPPMPIARPTPPSGMRTPTAPRIPTEKIAKIPLPPVKPVPDRAEAKIEIRPPEPPFQTPSADVPAKSGPYDAPTNPSNQSASIAATQLARPGEPLAIPQAHVIDRKSGPVRMPAVTTPMPPSQPMPIIDSGPMRRPSTSPVVESSDTSALEALIDEGKLEEAMTGYRVLVKKSPQDRGARAGIELVEGLRALGQRDRLEAAQRFESALEIDPSNERAARELADMRRQATNERKGLLSRLMGKKEGPP
jgi:predicted nucleic acid-binding protein